MRWLIPKCRQKCAAMKSDRMRQNKEPFRKPGSRTVVQDCWPTRFDPKFKGEYGCLCKPKPANRALSLSLIRRNLGKTPKLDEEYTQTANGTVRNSYPAAEELHSGGLADHSPNPDHEEERVREKPFEYLCNGRIAQLQKRKNTLILRSQKIK